jgi:alkylation response protein AidB-like acyl-CoA dehydrogenase
MARFSLDAVSLPGSAEGLRQDVRDFLAGEIGSGRIRPHCDSWLSGWDAAFSRRLGARGWIGMTFPRQYGGTDAGALHRFVVTEELLAAGAPVAAHWIADRQSGPALLRFGTEQQRAEILPGIARGELYFAIGMSEPDAGSDLASVRTRASRVDGGWLVSGAKLWTSGAHHAHFMITLVRTAPAAEADRHAGLSQLIIDLAAPGVQIRPIRLLTGEHHFNEVVLADVFVADSRLLGRAGDGWHQVTSELAFERSGPERILSTFPLLAAAVDQLTSQPDLGRAGKAALGALLGRLWVLRQMSLAIAARLQAGEAPNIEAAVVKDLGTRFETAVVEAVRLLAPAEPDLASAAPLSRLLAEAISHSPGFTLRGGTSEILRGIIAKGLIAP